MTARNPIHGYDAHLLASDRAMVELAALHGPWEISLRRAVDLFDGETEPPTADAALRRADGRHPYPSYAAGHLWHSPAR